MLAARAGRAAHYFGAGYARRGIAAHFAAVHYSTHEANTAAMSVTVASLAGIATNILHLSPGVVGLMDATTRVIKAAEEDRNGGH